MMEPGLIKNLMVIVLATATGFAASGIISNLYRLLAREPQSVGGHLGYCAVMVVAGPNVLFGKVATSLRQKSCSRGTFWFAACLTAYWSFILGLFVLSVSLSL